MSVHREPHAEQAEPVEQRLTLDRRERRRARPALANRSADSSSASTSVAGGRAEVVERLVLGLAQRDAGLREQPGHRHDGLGQPPDLRVVRVARGDRARPTRASRGGRRRPRRRARAPRSALTGVACETSSSWKASRKSTSVACRCRIRYSTASAAVSRSSPGARKSTVRADGLPESEPMPGVSISVIVAQRRRRPLDVEPLDVVGLEPAEVDVDGAVVAVERHLPGARPSCGWMVTR